jgi:hypothetical protein
LGSEPQAELTLQDVPVGEADRVKTIQSLEQVKLALEAKIEAASESRAGISERILAAQALR